MKDHRMVEGKRQRPLRTLPTFVASLLTVLITACSDTPTDLNSTGASLIQENVVVRDTTLRAIGSSSFKQFVPMDSLQTFGARVNRVDLVGRTGKYEAYTALQFYPSYFPNRDTIQVVSAVLTLRLVTWVGDSLGTCGFTVYKINQPWSQNGLRRDSIQTGFYDPAVVRGSYSGRIEADTQVVKVTLDTSMVREWLQPAHITSYGILLVPTPSSSVVRGINAFDNDSTQFYPTLEVIARNLSGTVQDTSQYSTGADTFVGNIDGLVTNPSLLYLQSGVVYRSTLIFDVSGIPRASLVNSAELLLVRDASTSKISRFSGTPEIEASLLRSESDNMNFEPLSFTGQAVGLTDTFSIDMRHAVQSWIKGPNYGLLLRATNSSEFNSLDLYTFYNQNAPAALRPRLHVKYFSQKF